MIGPDGTDEGEAVTTRMSDTRRLGRLVAEGADGIEAEVDAVAEGLSRFHDLAERSTAIDQAGAPEAVASLWQRSIRGIRQHVGVVLDADTFNQVATLADRCTVNLAGVLGQRVADGRVCDGHGDLQADAIFCLSDGPHMLGRLELDPWLRHGDVVDDVAALAMDLERVDRADLAERFISAYRAASGDRWPASLLHNRIAYRALLRTEDAGIRAEAEPDMADTARSLLNLTHSHLVSAETHLVLVGGWPRTGKSTLASALGQSLRWPVLHFDALDQQLAARSHTPRGGLDDSDRTAAVYANLVAEAGDDLTTGQSVIVDASWLTRRWRQAGADVATAMGANLVQLRSDRGVTAPIQDRRPPDIEHSDIAGGVTMASEILDDVWPDAIAIDTSGSPAHALALALEAIPVAGRPGLR